MKALKNLASQAINKKTLYYLTGGDDDEGTVDRKKVKVRSHGGPGSGSSGQEETGD